MRSTTNGTIEIRSGRRRWRPIGWGLLICSVLIFPDFASAQVPSEAPATRARSDVTTTHDGLRVVTFTVSQGRIVVNLPDDIRAGETVSGTVLAEATGSTNAEKAKNLADLNLYVLDLAGTRIVPTRPIFTWTPQSKTVSKYVIQIVEAGGRAAPAEMSASAAIISLSTSETQPVSEFSIPATGQAGRNMMILGPFDGNGANTHVSIGAAKPTEKPATLDLIAESPRKAVLQFPAIVTGAVQLTVTDGGKTRTATFRSVGIMLRAPKTSLSQGEQTTLTVDVVGLQGITVPMSFSIKTKGPIDIAGGVDQQFSIDPREVAADGTYTTTRLIVGAQPGSFNVNVSLISAGKP